MTPQNKFNSESSLRWLYILKANPLVIVFHYGSHWDSLQSTCSWKNKLLLWVCMAAQPCQVLPLQQLCRSLSSVFCRRLMPLQSPFCLESFHPGSTASLRETINLAVCFILGFVLCLCPVTPEGSCSYPVFWEGVLQLRRLWAHWPCWVPSPQRIAIISYSWFNHISTQLYDCHQTRA